MKRVTIKDVAAAAGVSFATVSRALGDHPEISVVTKARVREACRALGYVPNKAARGLAKKSTHTIGLVVPDISNPYFSSIALSIEQHARANAYRVLLCNSLREPSREIEALDRLLSQQVDGLIIAPASSNSQARIEQMTDATPRVYLGHHHDGLCSFIAVDDQRGAYEATRYLLRLGHRELVFLGGRQASRVRRLRAAGFRKAVEEDGALGREYPSPADADCYQHSYACACRLLAARPLPDAILACSDRIALAVLQAAEERAVRIPEDVSLIGFDDVDYARLPRIELTTVAQPKRAIGRLAVARLLVKMDGQTGVWQDILEPELIVRASCRKKACGGGSR